MENYYSIFIFIFTIFLLILAIVIIKNRQREERLTPKPSHLKANSHTGQSTLKNDDLKRRKIVFLILAMLIASLVAFLFNFKKGSVSSEGSNTFASMLPIWIAVFIPAIANKDKKKYQTQLNEKQKKARLYFLMGLILFLMTIISLVIFSNN